MPVVLTLLGAALAILLVRYFGHPMKPVYIVLVTAGLFGVLANLSTILMLLKRRIQLSGGAVSHIGIALMLLGILASAGYSNIISQNVSGLVYSKDFPEDVNRDNVLLWRNEVAPMQGYDVSYTGQYFDVPGVPEYVNKDLLFRTDDEFKAIARAEVKQNDRVYYKVGDTLEIRPENTYYRVEYKDRKTGKSFTLFPRAQVNEEMGEGLLASPDIKKFWDHDIYSHISTVPDPSKEKDWSEVKEHVLAVGDTIYLNDYFAVLRAIEPAHETAGLGLKPGDLAIQGDFIVSGEKKQYHVHPVFVVRDKMIGRIPDEVEDLGLRLSFNNVDPSKGKFTFGVSTTQKDYIILKAMEKPFINLLWSGTLLMGLGFLMALRQRNREPHRPDAPARRKQSASAQVA